MDKLLQQVNRAHRRLLIEQFAQRLVRCWFVALLVAMIALLVPRLVLLPALPAQWNVWWVAGSLGLGLVVAAAWTWLSHRSRLEAAIEIDGRFDLRERVASSLSLSDADLATPAGQALLSDTMRRIERIEVGDKFRLRLGRRPWLPLVPAAIAALVVALLPPRVAESNVATTPVVASSEQIKKSNEELAKRLAEKRKLAEQQGLKDAAEMFKQIEKGSDELTKAGEVDRKQATVKLNDLAKELEDRKSQLGGREELQKQLNNMKEFNQGPADKVAEAMKQGDWKKALGEIDKLRDQMKKGSLNKEQQEQLQKQLDKMQKKLADAAQQHRETMDELQKQIEQQKKNGDLAKAAELQQKLDKLAAQKPQMQQLEKLAQQMQQCQQCMQKGDAKGASDAMQQMADELKQMQQEMDEMAMLDEALEQIEMAKDAMNCKACNGQGCKECQGDGMANNNKWNDQPGGKGMGAGRGTGPRPDEPNPTNFRDTQVRQKPGQGAAVFGGFVDGPNAKGEAGVSVAEQLQSTTAEAADPLTAERLPRSRREHAEEYFHKLRDEL